MSHVFAKDGTKKPRKKPTNHLTNFVRLNSKHNGKKIEQFCKNLKPTELTEAAASV